MDIRRKQVEDIARSANRVVTIERKSSFAAGSLPMTDVVFATPKVARRSVRFALGASERLIATTLVVLMLVLPMTPAFASYDDDLSYEDEITETLVEENLNEEEMPVAEEAQTPFEETEEEEVAEADEQDEPSGTTSSASDESDAGNEDEVVPPGEEESGFDPNRLPSADNVPPEGWYDDDGVGEDSQNDEEGTVEDDEDAEDEESTPEPTIEEVFESVDPNLINQIQSKLYEEIVSQLEAEIAAFEEEKRALKDGCLQYEDGSFFCLNPDRETNGLGSATTSGSGTVYVITDPNENEGDGEIAYLPDGAVEPIMLTDDAIDDQFPSINLAGDAAVWQSYVNERWQIRYRDLRTGVVEQLTSSMHNSMHPVVQGDYVVWQAWPKNSWEVFLARRQAGGWSVEQITDNAINDMFPKVAGGFVTWQANDGSSWQVFAYDIANGETVQLSTDSEKHENPRVALIWDAIQEDGSTRVHSFDLTTGEAAPIGSRAPTPSASDLPQLPIADEDVIVNEEKPGAKDEDLLEGTNDESDE